MRHAKDHIVELENDHMRQWMMDTQGIDKDELDEDSEQWQALAQEYQAKLDGERADEEAAASEAYANYQEYMRKHPYDRMYQDYQSQLMLVRKLIYESEDKFEGYLIQKMAFVHAVTLMEALIGDMIKSLVVEHDFLMRRVGVSFEELAKRKNTVSEVLKHPGGINGIIMDFLSTFTFHNVFATKKLLEALFPENMKGLDISEIGVVIEKRHDFVHRNGRTIKDEPVVITQETLVRDLQIISGFAVEVYRGIYEVMDEVINKSSECV
ncbi:hypothetical protein ALP12_200027 [Pseudomonas savastanoi pv. phaseolicola]|uniref:hypothetical protein n=1 Tax=Pseudomonas savastanoi TaxID=29438 RepID=UPI0006B8E9E0|nr:hypothetical protein [Pseudomonas savastanoi]RMV27204.1 hypothetical protein ALP12_200027 [Pseudomonas savastanoi pv. phaseolicola]